MHSPEHFHQALIACGISFYAGVPDSLLHPFCAYLADHAGGAAHVTAANEGGAIALAAGYHLATGKTGLVYMQNSGIGNAVNPLVSLVDPEVYAIPLLLVIGWRGEPGRKDEPQHVKQGKITLALLETLGIPFSVIDDATPCIENIVAAAAASAAERGAPFALVVREGTFCPYRGNAETPARYEVTREQAIQEVLNGLQEKDIVVSTTGKASRELFESREKRGEGHGSDFLTVGSMGHASQIALGIAVTRPERRVWCLDGDGAAIMHAGGFATIGDLAPKNLFHLILNNGCHDSVGGLPTAGFSFDFAEVARAAGYRLALTVSTLPEIAAAVRTLSTTEGPVLLEIRVAKGSRKDLGRPTTTPAANKREFMESVAR